MSLAALQHVVEQKKSMLDALRPLAPGTVASLDASVQLHNDRSAWHRFMYSALDRTLGQVLYLLNATG